MQATRDVGNHGERREDHGHGPPQPRPAEDDAFAAAEAAAQRGDGDRERPRDEGDDRRQEDAFHRDAAQLTGKDEQP